MNKGSQDTFPVETQEKQNCFIFTRSGIHKQNRSVLSSSLAKNNYYQNNKSPNVGEEVVKSESLYAD